MIIPELPRVRALVDWDGDGFINRGVSLTDPLNKVIRPLTLNHQVWSQGQFNTIKAKYGPTDRGLYSYTAGIASGLSLYVGGDSAYIMSFADSRYGLYTDMVGFFNPTTTNYTLQFYIKGNSNYVGHTFTLDIQEGQNAGSPPYSSGAVTGTSPTIVLTANYQLVTFNFTVTGGFSIAVLKILHATGTGSTNLSVTGFQVLQGTYTTAKTFNVGTSISLRDDLEPYMLSANWQSGMATFLDNVASEGTLQLSLKNTNKEFSIESSSSFLYSLPAGYYGYPYQFPEPLFGESVLIVLEVQDDTTDIWYEVWRGYVDSIDVGTGTIEPTASLNASQGLFKFAGTHIDTAVLQGKTADQIIKILMQSGWITAVVPNQAAVSKTKLRDAVSYDVISDANTFQLDVGQQTYDFSGETWSTNTSPVDVIKELMVAEQGLFFIARDGKIRFMHRDRIYSSAASEPADIVLTDADVNTTDYIYTQSKVNYVKVDYYPKQLVNQALWSSKTGLTVDPYRQFITNAKLEQPENTKLTAISINSFTAAVLPSTYTVTDLSGNTAPASAVNITTRLRNGEVEITIQNYAGYSVLVNITLNGIALISYGGQSLYRSNEQAHANVGTRYETYSSKLITTDTMARNLGDYILAMYSKRYATFSGFSVASRDANWLTRILTVKPGTRVKLHETNTGGIDHRLMVVGESAQWTPGILTMTYTTRPADNVQYLILNSTNRYQEGIAY